MILICIDATYLDHSGATLYPASFIDQTALILKTQLLGNPHSGSPSSMLATKHVDDVRREILTLFNAGESEWDVVFVANSTAAIKLVADAFNGAVGKKKGRGFIYRYHRDAHTSLVGVRELAREWELFEKDEDVESWLVEKRKKGKNSWGLSCLGQLTTPKPIPPALFAYPAQSNLTGRRLPLQWAYKARNAHGYFTLLDAAALLMTKPLDLRNPATSPDYVSCSFYKIFGMPDLGALIVKRGPAADILRKREYFGGGTVSTLLAGTDHHSLKLGHPHESLEDGTVPFHSILMLGVAIKRHKELYGGFEKIGKCTSALAWGLYQFLSSLRHSNGAKVVEFYSTPEFLDSIRQGPILSFNLKGPHGGYIGFLEVEKRAAAENIHIRVGGNCNPGGVQWHCGFKESELKRMFMMGEKACGDNVDLVDGRPVGVVRVSLGAMSTWDDVRVFGEFVWRRWVDGGGGVSGD